VSKIDVKTGSDNSSSLDDLQAQIDAKVNTAIKKPVVITDPEPEKPAIEVKTVAKPPPATKPIDAAVVSHKGKMLDPANARKDSPVESGEATEKPKVAETVTKPVEQKIETSAEKEDVEPESVMVDTPATTPSAEPVGEKLGEISEQIKQDEAAKEEAREAKKLETQEPQIFDTKQYHLPIKATKHHASGSLGATGVLFVIFLLVLALAYAAADMEVYDPGFALPLNIF